MLERFRLPVAVVLSTLTLGLAACRPEGPEVGALIPPPEKPTPGVRLTLVDASASGGRVTVRLVVTRDGVRLGAQDAGALGLAWTLAALEREPVSGLPAWRSLVLTGAAIPSNPVAGPGTPAERVEAGGSQPGAETGGAWTDQGYGVVAYRLATSLPDGLGATTTLRAGVFLPSGPVSDGTTATVDLRPDGAPVTARRELVAEDGCAGCHAVLRAHGGTRTGTRVCVTCHTWQHADPETVDPAAPMAATAATNPNPLELGRLVHRLHRGKLLPTLYQASSPDPAPALPSLAGLPLPFSTTRTSATGKNPPVLGRRFAVVGEHRAERVYGQIATRADNGMPARTVAMGVTFPRDQRDCDACHAGAADAPAALATEVSRRSCAGCHPDVWFASAAPPDAVHFAHAGGPRADDAACGDCHVPTAACPDVLAPIGELHVALVKSPRYSRPAVTIVAVEDLAPGKRPRIRFRVSDRDGALDDLDAPTPPAAPVLPVSPVPRGLTSVSVVLAGPAAPDLRNVPASPPITDLGTTADAMPVSESVPLTLAASGGEFTHVMTYTVPAGASGTWLVTLQASRAITPSGVAAPFYDGNANRFAWPYTGERYSEVAETAFAWVRVGGGAPAPRRAIVELSRCNACHLRLTGHGSRTVVESCPMCHTPDRTDWRARNRDPVTRKVQVAGLATYDGLEERSTHFKTMIHRLHTGSGEGSASLSGLPPYVVYGPRFYDEARFPSDLARCTSCHAGTSYRVEEVPPDALPTVANETATVRHAGDQVHTTCAATPPITAACLGCHGNAYAQAHVGRYQTLAGEACASCHGAGAAYAVEKTHGFAAEE